MTHVTENVDIIPYTFEEMNAKGAKFRFDDITVQLHVLGEFNALNATAAGSIARSLGVNNASIKKGLENITNLPGRIERIDEGQDFSVIVDYAFEPVALEKLYKTISVIGSRRIIHVLGATGGGRDRSRRAILGRIAGEKADYVIITNEDPYDEDPRSIMEAVAQGVAESGKENGSDFGIIEDRGMAIDHAINLAKEKDLVLITGKGCEQAIVGKNGIMILWDDRDWVRASIKRRHSRIK
jgi:UDP-N-acetylmuramoyl-L-alanyl-D-glutamate--2,6-diaminopimelate ligase